MRLLFLANAASVHATKWVSFFASVGHDVHLVTWHRPATPSELDGAVCVHRVMCPPHYAMRYGTLWEAMRISRRIRPDLLHAHYLSHFGIIGGLVSRLTDLHPLVLTAWGSDVLSHGPRFRGSLIRHSLTQADCVTCDSPHMIPHLENLGARPGAVHIVNFGVDTERFTPCPPVRHLRTQLGIDDNPLIISLRSLQPLYDVATLVRAMPSVVDAVPRASLVIVGDGPERCALENLASSLGISQHVHFVGMVPNEVVPDYLNSADVYVSTSLSDAGIAASTAEAMACGLPVVATDFGDNGSWVRNGETGYLFPAGDSQSLADRLISLLGDRKSRMNLGSNGRREIVQRNSYQREMRKMERIYRALIERPGS